MIEPTEQQIRALWNAAVSSPKHETTKEWASRLLRAALNVGPTESLIVDGVGWAEAAFSDGYEPYDPKIHISGCSLARHGLGYQPHPDKCGTGASS